MDAGRSPVRLCSCTVGRRAGSSSGQNSPDYLTTAPGVAPSAPGDGDSLEPVDWQNAYRGVSLGLEVLSTG